MKKKEEGEVRDTPEGPRARGWCNYHSRDCNGRKWVSEDGAMTTCPPESLRLDCRSCLYVTNLSEPGKSLKYLPPCFPQTCQPPRCPCTPSISLPTLLREIACLTMAPVTLNRTATPKCLSTRSLRVPRVQRHQRISRCAQHRPRHPYSQ